MSEKIPQSEQPVAPEPVPEPAQVSEVQEHAPATFERASEELRKLKALGIEDPEFSDDERAAEFQSILAELDAASETLSDSERNEYPARRVILFYKAGFADPSIIQEQIEFLQQNLANESDRGNTEEVNRISDIISKVEQMLPKSPEPEIPTSERIGEILRQPGRLPNEVPNMIMDWKSAKIEELGKKVPALVQVEMEAAQLYADNGRTNDAIGSITSALIHNKKIKSAKPELKKQLEDYREELKRR